MPQTLIAAQQEFTHLCDQEREQKSTQDNRHLARHFANFATRCEKDKHHFSHPDLESLLQLITEGYSRALILLNRLSPSEQAIENDDIQSHHEITLRLSNHYQNHLKEPQKALECYESALECSDKFPLGEESKILLKTAILLLAEVSQILSDSKTTNNENTGTSSEDQALAPLLNRALNYLLEATKKQNLDATYLLGHYFQACTLLIPNCQAIEPEFQMLMPALELAAKQKTLRISSKEMFRYLSNSFQHYKKQLHYYALYQGLKTAFISQYETALTTISTDPEQGLAAFIRLVDDLGFPLELRFAENDLLAHILTHPELSEASKESLAQFLFSRGLQPPANHSYPAPLFTGENSEAKQLQETTLGLEGRADLIKIVVEYLGINTRQGNHAAFFHLAPQVLPQPKKRHREERIEDNKRFKEDKPVDSQEATQEQEGFDTQMSKLLSQTQSDASTVILSDQSQSQTLSF